MIEPGPPRPGEPLRASWAQRLIAHVRSLRVFAGPGLVARRTPSGTVVSLAPNAGLRRGRPPMPFDCRLGTGGGNGDETHLFCHVPQSAGWICQGCNGAVQPVVTALVGQSLSGDWLDCGEIAAGDSAWLFFTVSASNHAKYGHATPLYERPQAHVGIGSPSYSVPSGRSDAYVLFPPVRIATWVSSAGLRQAFHGIYDAEAAFGDSSLTGSGWGGTPGVRSLSIASTDYNGSPGVLSLHGFRSPTTISNPYKSGGTAPSSPDKVLVLVRVLSSDGKTAELQYVRLADLAASSAGEGTADDPEGYDALTDLTGTPCPVGHDRTTPLVIYWNPCDLEDAQGNVLQHAGWQQGQFWPVGGSAAVCKGASIGDSNGNDAIDLDGHSLSGDWSASSNFDVGGNLAVYGESAFGIATAADLTVFGTLTLGSGAGAMDVGATLNALLGRVTTVENSLSGLETLLSQI